MVERGDNLRAAVNRYYQRNTSRIIKNKTIKLARNSGRVPRMATIESHEIDLEELKSVLTGYALSNPDSRATRKIERFLHSSMDSKCP